MDKWKLAELLYAKGYEHREVRSIWAYVYGEQHVARVGKRKPWQQKALDDAGVDALEIVFEVSDSAELNSYF
jgi:hypothetical protein